MAQRDKKPGGATTPSGKGVPMSKGPQAGKAPQAGKSRQAGKGSQATGSARARQRGKPVQVQPKKPVGAIVGVTVLALALVAVLGFAFKNAGDGYTDPLARADASFGDALVKADPATLTREHEAGDLSYPVSPPNGGDHNGTWEDCAVYTEQVPDEYAVHSLEHGAAWVTYRPGLPAAQLATLREAVEGNPYAMLSPYPGQSTPIALTAWGRRVSVTSADDPMVEKFVGTYANGPQTPEKGAACSGGVSVTGAKPVAAG